MADLEHLLQKDLSKLFGVTRMTINRWTKEGMPKNSDGTYPGPACVSWLLNRMEEKIEKQAEAGIESEESLRWLGEFRKQRALIATIERKRIEGEFVPAEAVKGEYQARLQVLVAGLLNFGDRLAPLLAARSRDEIRETLADETELLMHAFYQRGQYTPAIAEEILAELGGKTNRQRRNEKCDWYQRKQREKTDDSTTAEN